MDLGHLRRSVFITSLLASAISLSACQQQEPEQSLEDNIAEEQGVPMSADPAEPNDTLITTDEDPSADEVADDTVATVNTGVTQLTYLCSPELKVEATYEDDDNQVVLITDQGTLTLTKTNDGSNPGVYEVATALDGSEGFTQWRVAHEGRATGVMRMAGADETKINTYECSKAESETQ